MLHSICQQIWKIQQWPQDWKRSIFIPIQKTGNAKECSNYCTISLISHAKKVMIKTLQAMLQQFVNWEFPDVQVGFRKGRGTRDEIANICWIIEKAREFQKNTYFFFIDYAGDFACVDYNKLWKMLMDKVMAPRSSTFAWKIPWTEEPGGLQSRGSLRVGHDWALSLSLFTFMHWRRKWQPTPVLLPGESQGRGSLVGCCLGGHVESTEA